MINKRIPLQLATLAVFLVITPILQAQATPISIDFESPYTVGMPTGSFPSIWTDVETGTTVTGTDALAGSQSLLIGQSSFADLYINAPNDATELNISMLYKPIDGGAFANGGAIVLQNETNASPSDGFSEPSALTLTFRNGGSAPDAISEKFHGSSTEYIPTTWISGTSYSININLNYVSHSISYSIADGGSMVQSGSGTYGYHADQDFVLQLHGSQGSGTSVLADSIQIAAVPEPSSFATIAGLASLSLIALRRRRIKD